MRAIVLSALAMLLLACTPVAGAEGEPTDRGMVAPRPPEHLAIQGQAQRTSGLAPDGLAPVRRAGSDAPRLLHPGLSPRPTLRTSRSSNVAGSVRTPGVAGPIDLTIGKSWNGYAWDLNLAWTGNTGATTIAYSTDPSFESFVLTLEREYTPTTLTIEERDDRPLELFDVTDSTTASRSVQGIGYDPHPYPGIPTVTPVARAAGDLWWWGDIDVDSDYLDPMRLGNTMAMQNRVVRPYSVTTNGGTYAYRTRYTIPEDTRGFWSAPQAHGRAAREAKWHPLVPRDVGPYTNLRSIVFAEQTGHVWVAADGKVEELDIFKIQPDVVRTFSDATKPRLSRVTGDGRILYVDGVAGVTTIWQVDVTTGARSAYATTTDTNFDRPITPMGIAAAIDGGACYIADGSAGTIVRIPESNGADITDDWGSWPFWGFADPAGIETTKNGSVLVGAVNNWVGIIPDQSTTWWAFDTFGSVRSLYNDRDVSPSWGYNVYWGEEAFAHAYNRNPLAAEGLPARYVGANLSEVDDKIVVAPLWDYMPRGRHVVWPSRVVLNREGEDYAYSWKDQVADRLVKIDVHGWNNIKLHLRLIDPPDLSPYAPDGGFAVTRPGASKKLPYEAWDNKVWTANPAVTDFGLTTSPSGTISGGPVLELDVTPDASHWATVYLKLPESYAGDNWMVEVTKKDYNGNAIANKIPGYSAIYTGWKRSYLERDRMFRRGGLLSQQAWPGDSFVYLANLELAGNWVQAHFLQVGDTIVVFDTDRPVGRSYDTACVKAINNINQFEVKVDLAWTLDCTTPFLLAGYYNSSVDPITHQWTFDENTRSGGVGVISGCSTAPNKVHTMESCFFAADLRHVEGTFNDAYMEFLAPGTETGEYPYMPGGFFEQDTDGVAMAKLSQLWFDNFQPWSGTGDPPAAYPHNYFHLVGASLHNQYWGLTSDYWDDVFVFVGQVLNAGQGAILVQDTTNHELAHLFGVNPDHCEGHDTRDAWCGSECSGAKCLMHDEHEGTNGHRLCQGDLLDGAATGSSQTCSGQTVSWEAGDGAIRTADDPE